KNDSYWNGDIPWVTTSEVKFGVITETVQKITQEGLDNSAAKLFPKDTILIAMYGQGKTRGQVAKLGFKASTNQACAALLLYKEHDADFYYQYLSSQYENIRELANSGGQQNLSAGIIKDINVPIPPLPEQRKIAKILSTWDKAITTTESLIAISKQQKKALMQQLLTGKKRLYSSPKDGPETGEKFEGEWVEVKLGDICHVNPKKPKEPENGFVSFIPMDAVSEEAKLIRTELKLYSDVSKGFTAFINDDTLVAKITPCFENGKGAQVTALENGIGFGSTEFHVLRAKKKICPQFIYFLTITSGFRIRGEMNMQGSAGQKRVTTDYLTSYKTLIPKELKEQQKIAQVLTTADKDIELLQAKLAHFKQEKKALMQQLLTGKRRVKIDTEVAA
ncbi:restriction endonuclease subunit S, partial [Vibrio casei]